MFYNLTNVKQNTTLLKFFGLSYILSVILFSKDMLCSGLLDEPDMLYDSYEESLYETFSITNEEELELVDVRNKAEAIFEDEGFITFKDLIKQSLTDLNKIYEDLLKYESFQNEFLGKLRIIVVSSSDSVLENQETFKPFVDELDNLINEKKNFEDAIAHSRKVFDFRTKSEILLEISLVVKDLFSFEGEYPDVDPFEKFYMLLQILEKEIEEIREYYKDLVTLILDNMDIFVKKKINLTSMFGSRFAKKKRLGHEELKNEIFDDFYGRVVKEKKALFLLKYGLKGLISHCECILFNFICFQERFK